MTSNSEQNKKDVLQLVEKMQKSWHQHDAKAYAESFAEDATFTTVFGNINEGRIAKYLGGLGGIIAVIIYIIADKFG